MDHCAAPPRRASLCVKREGGRKGEKRRWGVPEKASKVVTPGINRFYQICISTIARYLRPRSLLQKSLPPFAWVLSTPSWLRWHRCNRVARGVGTDGASRLSRNRAPRGGGLERREKILVSPERRRKEREQKTCPRASLVEYLFEKRWCGLPSPRRKRFFLLRFPFVQS